MKIVKKKERSLKDLEPLKREIEVLMKVDHPNIIGFYELFIDKNFVHFVT